MPMGFIDDKSTLVQVMVVAVRQQAITWTSFDPDLWCHITPTNHTELMISLFTALLYTISMDEWPDNYLPIITHKITNKFDWCNIVI